MKTREGKLWPMQENYWQSKSLPQLRGGGEPISGQAVISGWAVNFYPSMVPESSAAKTGSPKRHRMVHVATALWRAASSHMQGACLRMIPYQALCWQQTAASSVFPPKGQMYTTRCRIVQDQLMEPGCLAGKGASVHDTISLQCTMTNARRTFPWSLFGMVPGACKPVRAHLILTGRMRQ